MLRRHNINYGKSRTKAIRLQNMATFSCSRLLAVIFSMIFVTIIFQGCASSPADFSGMKSLPQNEGLVFGRIIATAGLERVKFENVFGTRTHNIIILPDNSSNAIHQYLENDGYFYLQLPPGSYVIAYLEKFDKVLGGDIRDWRIFAHFTVTSEKVSYIGRLTLVLQGSQYKMFIEDEYGIDIMAFREKFPGIKERVTKSLMKMEEMR